ncbi:amidohydrolase family protein [Membranihabitans maritimus]|uniref:amidohydrolase family protein n=1 Tax=Membranihabitans maritimus TaxID=2904244 RepID=UPI001F3ADB4D|nr:amidohydrolase family protein [Membranihabitans maritimus]
MKKDFQVFDPSQYGLPTLEELKDFRIWDTHYHGYLTGGDPIAQNEKMLSYVKRMGVERVVSVDIGGTLPRPLEPKPYDDEKRKFLEDNANFFSGIIPIDPGFPDESVKKMEEWIESGPCIGIKYVGGNQLGVTCDHPNNDIIINKAKELDAVIYIHTWIKTGGDPRVIGGANLDGESAPWHVAELAQRFPDTKMICGHAGGDWELGTRAIRKYENVFFEFSGADPHSGSVDLAVNELGADRIVWGGHGPSRSYSTEISKVLDASISHEERVKIFGGNYRILAAKIFEKKGLSLKP